MVVPSPQGVSLPAPELADDIIVLGRALVEKWRTLSPVEREIIMILVTSWAAHDTRAGLAVVQREKRSA
jgi:hypothetical protein